jgi:hypothetical protein
MIWLAPDRSRSSTSWEGKIKGDGKHVFRTPQARLPPTFECDRRAVCITGRRELRQLSGDGLTHAARRVFRRKPTSDPMSNDANSTIEAGSRYSSRCGS